MLHREGSWVRDALGGLDADKATASTYQVNTDDNFGHRATREDGPMGPGIEDATNRLPVIAPEQWQRFFPPFPEITIHVADGISRPSAHQVSTSVTEIIAIDVGFLVDGVSQFHAFGDEIDIVGHGGLGPDAAATRTGSCRHWFPPSERLHLPTMIPWVPLLGGLPPPTGSHAHRARYERNGHGYRRGRFAGQVDHRRAGGCQSEPHGTRPSGAKFQHTRRQPTRQPAWSPKSRFFSCVAGP